MRLAVLGLTLLVSVLGVSIVQAHVGPTHVDLEALPKNVNAATADGWSVSGFCVPGMGRHSSQGGFTLMYDGSTNGKLIGIEFSTRSYTADEITAMGGTYPVSAPFDGPMPTHGPSDGLFHFDVQAYFEGKAAARACNY